MILGVENTSYSVSKSMSIYDSLYGVPVLLLENLQHAKYGFKMIQNRVKALGKGFELKKRCDMLISTNYEFTPNDLRPE